MTTTRKRIRTRRKRRPAKPVRVVIGKRVVSIATRSERARLGPTVAECGCRYPSIFPAKPVRYCRKHRPVPAPPAPVTDAVLKRMADAPRPSLVRRIDPVDGVTVLEVLNPFDPARNPFRHAHAGTVSRKRRT